jgi:hypothetical protein
VGFNFNACADGTCDREERKGNIMNEIEKFNTEIIHLDDEIYDRYERMKADIEWWDSIKYQFKKFAKETGISKWTTDRWVMNYITPKMGIGLDTEKMKESTIWITNAETGELDEVNAYDYFATKKTFRSPYVQVKEKE